MRPLIQLARQLWRDGEQQHHGDHGGDSHQNLKAVDKTLEHQAPGKATVVKNQSELVSQIATRVVNTTPPTTGRDQEGVSCERTKVTLAAKAP